MKYLLLCGAIALLSFSVTKFTDTKASAEVTQLQGFYIFVDAKPLGEYKFMGTVELVGKDRRQITSQQYQAIRDALVKRARRLFPDADGLIFDLHDGGVDKADAIKFK